MTKKLKIVMFGMGPYENWFRGIENRNLNVVQELLKKEEVEKILYIDYLPWTFKQAVKISLDLIKHYWPANHNTTYPTPASRLKKYSDKLFVLSDFGYYFNQAKFYQRLKKTIRLICGDDYIVWSYYAVDVACFDELKPELTVFDLVDNWAQHQTYVSIKDKLLKNYQIITQKADLIFTVAERFKNWLGDEGQIHWIPNGVDLAKYKEAPKLIDKDLAKIPEPRLGYVGIIQNRIDYDLLEYCLKHHPKKSFVFIGSVWASHKKYIERLKKQYKNFYWLGHKKHQDIPSYFQQFNLGIIPHTLGEWAQYTDSMKVYHFLAAGLPIVITPTPNLEQFGNLIHLAQTPEEFSEKIDEALLQNSSTEKAKRQAAVEPHQWTKRINTMLSLIQEKLNQR